MCPSPQEPLGANEVSLKVMAKLCVLVSPQSVLRSKSRCVCARSLTSSGPPVVLVLSWLCTDTFVGDCLAFLDASAPVCRCDAGMSVWAGVYGVENAPCPVLSHSTITRGPSGIICAQSFKATGEHGPSASSLDIPSPPLLKPIP